MDRINENELKELFIEIKYNNKIAYDKLYNRYKQMVYGIAFSILKNRQDSEDVVQSVFTKIYEIDKSKLPTSKESSWLYTTTKNQAITFLRKRNEHLDLDSIYEIEDKDNEINNVINQDSYNRLVSKLNEKEKEVISLKILSNLSFDEISKLLNEPVGTIKWRYYKSINTLKILLSNLGMFVITFAIGIKTMANGKKMNNAESIVEDSQNNVKDEVNNDEQNKSESIEQNTESNKDFRDELANKNEIYDNQEEIIIQDVIQDNVNYTSVGFLSISAVFMIITIIFSIIFIKHQLKSRKKTSK